MAARLTDRQKKKIVADYAQLGSCNAVAKLNGCSPNTVKKIVHNNADIAEMKTQQIFSRTWIPEKSSYVLSSEKGLRC